PEPRVPEFAMRNDTCMESDSGKRAKESGVRDRRYSIRHPFATEVEMLELKSGSRVSGVTSDLSRGGCFVCTRRTLEVGARVRERIEMQSFSISISGSARAWSCRAHPILPSREMDLARTRRHTGLRGLNRRQRCQI